jgi:peptidoglycan/LPS O-acetylase OafA/YrhL
LLVFWPLVLAGIVAAMYLSSAKSGTALPAPKAAPGTILPFPLTHLWFLYVLLGLYIVLLALRSLVLALPVGARGLPVRVDALVARICTLPMAPAVLALPVALALYAHPHWHAWAGIPTPDNSLLPNAPALVAFWVAVCFGWLLRRQPQGLEMLTRHAPLHGLAALGLTSACLAIVGLTMNGAELSGWHRAGYALAYGVAGWCWTFAIIGAAQRFLSRPGPWRRYLADASYWIYLVHLPLVFGLQAQVQDWPLPGALKFLLVFGIAMSLLLLSYHLWVRSTWVGYWLNGRRHLRQRGAVVQPGAA